MAFDSGPGNMIVDATVEILTDGQQRFDDGGKMAAKGKVNQSLLTFCLSHPYLQLSPPKSTGREEFGYAFSRQAIETAQSLQIPTADLLATLTFFSAQTIADHYQKFLPLSIDEIRLSGGGIHNQTLMTNLSALLKSLFETTSIVIDEISDAKEAVAFAILANETVSGNCANLPQVTGSSQPTMLGKITPVP
jgi:anhydro-N-acetylmuramic acid kinase